VSGLSKPDPFAAREGLLRSTLRALARRGVLALFDRSMVIPMQATARNILMVRWDGKLGDAFVSSFFYREAKRCGARVSVVTTTSLVELHAEHFGADVVLGTSRKPGLMELMRLAWRLQGVDTVVHLTERITAREIIFLWLLRPCNVFSLDDNPRWVNGKLGNDTATLRFDEKYAAVLRRLGMAVVDTAPVIPIATSREGDDVDVVFNPFGSRPDKSISIQRAVSTLRQLAARHPKWRIGVLNCAKTRLCAEKICDAVGLETVTVCRRTQTIRGMIDTLWAALLVISVDTSVVHIAAGMRKPLLAIYPWIGSDANPWLPPPRSSTLVVYSPVDEATYRAAGLKCLDNYLDEEVLGGIESLTLVGAVVDFNGSGVAGSRPRVLGRHQLASRCDCLYPFR
jgi:ADP-heptose:LPS heptosyltransferase